MAATQAIAVLMGDKLPYSADVISPHYRRAHGQVRLRATMLITPGQARMHSAGRATQAYTP